METLFIISFTLLSLELLYAAFHSFNIKNEDELVDSDFIWVLAITLAIVVFSGLHLLLTEYLTNVIITTAIVPIAFIRLNNEFTANIIDPKRFSEPEMNTIQDYINEANESHDFTKAFSYIVRLMKTKDISMNNLSERVKTFMCNCFHIPTINDHKPIMDNVVDCSDFVFDE